MMPKQINWIRWKGACSRLGWPLLSPGILEE